MGFADKLSMEKCHLSSIDDKIDAFSSSINDKMRIWITDNKQKAGLRIRKSSLLLICDIRKI